MNLLKSKKEKYEDEFKNYLNNINLDSPNEQCEEIDNKLTIIFNNTSYEDYLSFLKSNNYLVLYDDILSKYANNIPLANELIKAIPDDMYKQVNKLLDKKIKEIKKGDS